MQPGRVHRDRQDGGQRVVDADRALAMLSHELRGPLFALLGWTRLLRETGLTPERRQRAVDIIERSALTQAALVEGLLDVSRIQNAKLSIEATPVTLCKLVEEVVESLRPAAEAKGVELKIETQGGLVVRGDELRLSQVVMNLLSNAIKFTPKGGVVTSTVHGRGDRVVFAVADTGRGIRPDALDEIFGCFVQDAPPDSRAGVGLGLFIVRELVELHHGRVHAESKGQGLGACFTVDLPRHVAAQALTAAE